MKRNICLNYVDDVVSNSIDTLNGLYSCVVSSFLIVIVSVVPVVPLISRVFERLSTFLACSVFGDYVYKFFSSVAEFSLRFFIVKDCIPGVHPSLS